VCSSDLEPLTTPDVIDQEPVEDMKETDVQDVVEPVEEPLTTPDVIEQEPLEDTKETDVQDVEPITLQTTTPAVEEPLNDIQQLNTTQVQPTTRDNTKFITLRIAIPSGNVIDVKGDISNTFEETIQQLKSDSTTYNNLEQDTNNKLDRLDRLEKLMEKMMIKLDQLTTNTLYLDNNENNIDEGNIDEGNIDEGNIDEGNIDEGNIDESNIEDEELLKNINIEFDDDLNDDNTFFGENDD
jgi:hypothetical protein